MAVVVTYPGALAAATAAGLAAVSLRKATAGAAAASAFSRRRTGAMAAGWHVEPLGIAARVLSGTDYTIYNEFGTSRMSAQPMARPSMDVARSA